MSRSNCDHANWRFFSDRPVERYIFLEVCSVLELNWREMASAPPAEFSDPEAIAAARLLDIDVLVQQVRSQRQDKIQALAIQCDRGEFAANRVPLFITLKDFADESVEANDFS